MRLHYSKGDGCAAHPGSAKKKIVMSTSRTLLCSLIGQLVMQHISWEILWYIFLKCCMNLVGAGEGRKGKEEEMDCVVPGKQKPVCYFIALADLQRWEHFQPASFPLGEDE